MRQESEISGYSSSLKWLWQHSLQTDETARLRKGVIIMAGKIDKGRSILNATDETANPYGLILSEKEREVIYGDLTRLDNMTNVFLTGEQDGSSKLKQRLLQ